MTSRLLRPILSRLPVGRRIFHTTKWTETTPKRSGFPILYDKQVDTQKNQAPQLTNVLKLTAGELKKWRQEWKDDFLFNQNILDQADKVHIQWQFKGEESLDDWVCTCDQDYELGHSTAKLEISQTGTGIFSGVLDTKPPQDGKTFVTGFCNITTTPIRKSFMRQTRLDWGFYSHLVLRIRGDGRIYLLNINVPGRFDITRDDIRHYQLFTAGGPYWQVVKIPFSKFVLASRGTVQDSGHDFPLVDVATFGITLSDKLDGPFKLEIDYVGVERVTTHFEKTAYEYYDTNYVRN